VADLSDQQLDRELTAALRAGGHRVTIPRLVVHRHVRRATGHLTPEAVHSQLSGALPSLSAATIYSTLELLDELRLVRRVSTLRGGTVYDPRVDDHHHLICRNCGRVQDFDAPVPMAAAETRARELGFRPDRGELQLIGVCSTCAEAVTAPERASHISGG
jgi:Fe2+ or Zn2+ uptake regulation protein